MQAQTKKYKHPADVREYLRLKQKKYREKHKIGEAPASKHEATPTPAINSEEVNAID